MSSPLEKLFGPTIQTKAGNKPTSEALSDCEAIGIYFSAHWCPPCKHFTPMLAKTYKELRGNGKKFEIVFVSSDKDQNQFDLYYSEHPWLALPYEDRDRKGSLSGKYKVGGIPTLVVVDGKTGETITTKGRSAVVQSPEKFPWIPPSLSESIGSTLVDAAGESVDAATVKNKTLGLYFSAHWCGPCRGFTPQLISMYNKMKSAGKLDRFEIVFISSDRDEGSFKEYFSSMPWLALPFFFRDSKEEISDRFDIEGIPSFVVVGPEDDKGNRPLINADARGLVGNADPKGEGFPWPPPLVTKLQDSSITSTPTVVLLSEGCDDDKIEELKGDLEKVAKIYRESKDDDDEINFSYAEPGDGLADRIRTITKIGPPTDDIEMLLFDLNDNGAYYRSTPPTDEIAADDIQTFISGWKNKSIPRLQLQ